MAVILSQPLCVKGAPGDAHFRRRTEALLVHVMSWRLLATEPLT